MVSQCCLFTSIFLFFWSWADASTSTLKDKIYHELDSAEYNMCFRRFNETHQIGCASNRHGNVGVLQLVRTEEDLKWLSSSDSNNNYIILMSVEYFKLSVIKKFIELKKVQGVLLNGVNDSNSYTGFSPDLKIPNKRFNLYGEEDIEWNAFGTELMFMDIPFPVAVLTNSSTVSFLEECFEKHNTDSKGERSCPWCAVRMKAAMAGAQDSVVCHRRSHMGSGFDNQEGFCDPLGGHNVLASVGPWESSEPFQEDSIIMIAARMDSFSMFDNMSPGMDSATTGFVALHTVANIIGQIKEMLPLDDTPILFALFNGESFGYTGSKRFIFDLNKKKIPYLNVKSIKFFIELSQLGIHRWSDNANKAYIHIDRKHYNGSIAKRDVLVDTLIQSSSKSPGGIALSESKVDSLPPSSLQTFLMEDNEITGVVISNHDHPFMNIFYNSFLDDASSLDMFIGNMSTEEKYFEVTDTAKYIQSVSTTVSCAIYKLATNSTDCDAVPSANISFISHLFYCFAANADCELFNSSIPYQGRDKMLSAPDLYKLRYLSPFTYDMISVVTMVHQSLLVRSLGTVVNSTFCSKKSEGDVDNSTYFKLNGDIGEGGERTPICLRAQSAFTYAFSPIFSTEDLKTGTNFPSWTESRWSAGAFSVDVFLLPCYSQEIKTVLLGLTVFLSFIPLMGFVKYRLFKKTAD